MKISINPPKGNNELQNIVYLNVGTDEAINKIHYLISQAYTQDQNVFEFDIKVKPINISKHINCGKMNDEIYVDYINRIFDSSLDIKTSLKLVRY